jgi:hypothetical protein
MVVIIDQMHKVWIVFYSVDHAYQIYQKQIETSWVRPNAVSDRWYRLI